MIYIPLILSVVFFIINFFILKKRFSIERYLKDINRELSGLTDDFNRNTNMNVTILETKINDLKSLIEKSDKMILLMKKELANIENSIGQREKLLNKNTKKTDSQPDLNSGIVSSENKTFSEYEKVLANKNSNFLAMQAAKVYGGGTAGKKKADTQEKAEEKSISTRDSGSSKKMNDLTINQKVNDLVNQGFSVEFIAEKLGLSISEVNLILFMGK